MRQVNRALVGISGTSFRAAVHESRVDKYAGGEPGGEPPRSFRRLRTCRGDSLPTISGCLVLRVQQTRGCGSPAAYCFHSCRVGAPTSAHRVAHRFMNADICHNRTVPPWRRLAGRWALGLNATPNMPPRGPRGMVSAGMGALTRPGGGLGTKIHLAADRRCRPVSRILSPGRAGRRAPIAPGPAIARPLKSGAAAIPSRPALSRCGNHHDPVMTSYLPPSSPKGRSRG